MIAETMETAQESEANDARQELLRHVEVATYRQVQDLDIDLRGKRITVRGRSQTYYIKQLVTQTILSTVPAAKLENQICVHAG